MGEGNDVAKVVRAIADGLLDHSTGQIKRGRRVQFAELMGGRAVDRAFEWFWR
jgi:hypothetical protein